jgi:hypothetical protein
MTSLALRYSIRAGFLSLTLTVPGYAQDLLLNGSLEAPVPVLCAFNLPNPNIALTVPGVSAWGPASEVDVMNAPGSCGYLDRRAIEGTTKLGLAADPTATGLTWDAISIKSAAALTPGQDYVLNYSVYPVIQFFSPQVAPLLIGLAEGEGVEGLGISVEQAPPTVWTSYAFVFQAPSAANFVTARPQMPFDSWLHVDAFHLFPAAAAGSPTAGSGLMVSPAMVATGEPTTVTLRMRFGELSAGQLAALEVAGQLVSFLSLDANGAGELAFGATLAPSTAGLDLGVRGLALTDAGGLASTPKVDFKVRTSLH